MSNKEEDNNTPGDSGIEDPGEDTRHSEDMDPMKSQSRSPIRLVEESNPEPSTTAGTSCRSTPDPSELCQVGLLDLPDHVLLCILQYCSPSCLKALAFTCERLGGLVLDRSLWVRVDARSEPSGINRFKWLFQHGLHDGTTFLAVSGFAREVVGFSTSYPQSRGGHKRRLEPEDKKRAVDEANNKPSTSSASSQTEGKYERATWNQSAYNIDNRINDSRPKYTVADSSKCPVKKNGSHRPVVVNDGLPGPRFTLTNALIVGLNTKCPRLTEIRLEYCNLNCKTTHLSFFPPTVIKLSLRGTNIFNSEYSKTILFQVQNYLPYLEYLDVSECDWMEPDTWLSLARLEHLRTFIATDCMKLKEFVAYASLTTKYGFRKVEYIDLCRSPVGDSEVSALAWLPSLRELHLEPQQWAPEKPPPHIHYRNDQILLADDRDPWERTRPSYLPDDDNTLSEVEDGDVYCALQTDEQCDVIPVSLNTLTNELQIGADIEHEQGENILNFHIDHESYNMARCLERQPQMRGYLDRDSGSENEETGANNNENDGEPTNRNPQSGCDDSLPFKKRRSNDYDAGVDGGPSNLQADCLYIESVKFQDDVDEEGFPEPDIMYPNCPGDNHESDDEETGTDDGLGEAMEHAAAVIDAMEGERNEYVNRLGEDSLPSEAEENAEYLENKAVNRKDGVENKEMGGENQICGAENGEMGVDNRKDTPENGEMEVDNRKDTPENGEMAVENRKDGTENGGMGLENKKDDVEEKKNGNKDEGKTEDLQNGHVEEEHEVVNIPLVPQWRRPNIQARIFANFPNEIIGIGHIPADIRRNFRRFAVPRLPALDPRTYVTDQAIRYFGRSEDDDFVHIGPRGQIVPGMPPCENGDVRPDRSPLRVLTLRGYTRITNASLTHLIAGAPNLERLDVRHTKVTAAAVERFRMMRPDCEVLFEE